MGILSVFGTKRPSNVASTLESHQSPALLFNNCQAGMVFRAISLVHAYIGVGLSYSAPNWEQWLVDFGLMTWVALPATLGWLTLGCTCRPWLNGKPHGFQFVFGVLLGAAMAWAAARLLFYLPYAVTTPLPPLAAAASGALIALLLIVQANLRRNAVAPENATAQLKQLQARIQPHFLFNALNSAIALVKLEPEKAEDLLQDLADLFHHAISKSNTVLTLNDELILVRQYLAIEKIRFEDRLEIHWDIDPDSLDANIVPLMLQPLVENAVKHGIEPSLETGHIWIHTISRRKSVEIRIENTLSAYANAGDRKTSTGIGLRNVATRLQLFYDMEAHIETAIQDGRYRVYIQIPRRSSLSLVDNHSTFV